MYGYFNFRPKNLTDFFETHPDFVLACVREYMMFMVRGLPHLYQALCEQSEWEKIEKDTIDIMDSYRKTIYCDFIGSRPKEYKLTMPGDYSIIFPRKPKSTHDNLLFVRTMIRQCELVGVGDLSIQEKQQLKNLVDGTAESTRGYLFISNHDSKFKNLFEAISMFGMSGDLHVVDRYIESLSKKDFQRLFYFFKLIHERTAIEVIQLPYHHYVKNMEAICRKEGVQTPEELSVNAGKFGYCIHCGFKGYVISEFDPSEKMRISSQMFTAGVKDAMYDPTDGQMYCFQKPKIVSYKPPVRKTAFEMFCCLNDFDPLAARHERKNRMIDQCRNTPIQMISHIGNLVKCHGRTYGMCSNCANAIEITSEKYHSDGYICRRCSLNNRPYTIEKCFFCEKLCDTDHRFPKVRIYDDISNPPMFREVPICKKDQKHTWIEEISVLSHILMRLSEKATLEPLKRGKNAVAPFYIEEFI